MQIIQLYQLGESDATVTVTAKENTNFTGAVTKHFTITEREVLVISGIDNNQTITYTGRPVELIGNLAVSENDGNITVDNIQTKWYDESGEIEQPKNVGAYSVNYYIDDDDYIGSLTVNFAITPAQSNGTMLLTQLSRFGDIKVPAGSNLTQVEALILAKVQTMMPTVSSLRDLGVAWKAEEPSTVFVTPGQGAYPVYYVQSENHLPTEVQIPIYGLTQVILTASVDGDGGTVSPEETTVLEGTETTVTFTPENGYKVSKVTVNEEEVEVNENKITVTAETTPIVVVATFEKLPITYNYLEGNGQKYTLDSNKVAMFRIDAEYELLDKVYVDDGIVSEANYNSKSGSTVIELTKEFMKSLAVGTHNLKVTFTDGGVAATTFTVAAAENATPTNETVAPTNQTETVDNTVATATTNTVANTATTSTTTSTTSNTPKTGDKVLVDIYIAIVSGLGIFMIIDHKLNSKPRKGSRRSK